MYKKFTILSIILLTILVSYGYEPETLQHYSDFGKFYFRLGRFEKAVEYFEKILALEPMNQIALNYLSMISREADYVFDELQQDTPEVTLRSGDAYQWYLNGKIQYERKNYEDAAQAFIRAYELAPEEEAFRYWTFKTKGLYELEEYKELQDLYEREQDLKEITEQIKENGRKDEFDSHQWFVNAKFNYNHDKTSEALNMLEISLLLNPENNKASKLLEEIIRLQQEPTEITPYEEVEVKAEPSGKSVQIEKVTEKKDTKEPEPEIINEEEEEEEEEEKDSLTIIDKKIISSSEMITLEDHIGNNNKIIAGMYALDKKGVKVRSEIKKEFEKANQYKNEGKFALMTQHTERAYLKALEYDKTDLRALYYLYLISQEKEDTDSMQKYFFSLIDILNNRFHKKGDYYNKSKELIDNLVYSMIIQGAYTAWVERTGDKNFSPSTLVNQGFIKHKEITPVYLFNNAGERITWEFTHLKGLNSFKLDNGTVVSKQYGVSPFMAREYYISEK
ncbi:MAG: tetratricopeptide repeat protein [Candidatus Muiribacteriota bacterium]